MKKRGVLLDIVLILIAMIISVVVRLPATFKDDPFSKEPTPEFIDQFYTEEDHPYLQDPDSYFYAKQAVDLAKEPSIFSNFGKYNLLAVITTASYKLLNPITGISLETLFCYIGPLIFALSCIPAYLFIKKKSNRAGGFTAALLLGISPILVGFSMATRFDTDILLTLLPLTMVLSFIAALEAKTTKKNIIYLSIAALSFFLLTLTWESCLVYAALALVISFVVILSSLIKDKFKVKDSFKYREFKIALIFPLILLIVSVLMHDHITSIFRTISLTASGASSSFPSPGAYVSELRYCSMYQGGFLDIFNVANCGVVNLLGAFPLVIVLGVCIILFTQKNLASLKTAKKNPLFIVTTTLVIWLLVGIVSSAFGVRFIKNAAIPAALLAGLGIGFLYEKYHSTSRGRIIIALIWILVCFPSFRSYTLAQNATPSANDSLATATSYIRENFDQDYVVASWWDLGYFYEYQTNLKTLANGGTYDSHVYYWLANAFLTKDELLSSRIFKMLASSNLQAPELAKSIVGDYATSSKMLKQILPMSKNKAKDTLISEHNFTAEQADDLLSLTHQDAKVVVIVTKNMIPIINSISYFGCWSFNDQFKSTEPACTDNDKEKNENSYPPYLLYRLYHEDTDTDYFTHITKIDDQTDSFNPNIWAIK